MYRLDDIRKMRDMYYHEGMTYAAIAKELNCDYRTVEKYVRMEDFSPRPPGPVRNTSSKLDPYKSWIDATLTDDLQRRPDQRGRRKQVHTARRIFVRLGDEFPDFHCSYRTVASYVRRKRDELRLNRREGYLPLSHPPGTAQADFGTAAFTENGICHEKGKYLVLSFPYSNAGYTQLCYGKNLECLLEGLMAIFGHIGGVPTEIWFDNASAVVEKILKNGERKVRERFSCFETHFGFKAVFMNPASGHEKGNVENKVGYTRRNLLVPPPEFTSLQEENVQLLRDCDRDIQREHYTRGDSIAALFEEDRKHLLALPSCTFDPARYEVLKTDKYGKVTVDRDHTYSVSTDYALTQVKVRLTATTVTVMSLENVPIVVHSRLYGPKGLHQESMNIVPYLRAISRKPRSLHNSGLYGMLPPPVQSFLSDCAPGETRLVLRSLAEVAERSGFETAVQVVQEAIEHQAHDADSLNALYRRLTSDTPALPPLSAEQLRSAPKLETIVPQKADIASLDSILNMPGGDSVG